MSAFLGVPPQTGFLREYLDYAGQLTDAPDEFHLPVGWALIGTALENRVIVQFGDHPIYANIWVVKVGPPTFRKSTTDDIGLRVLRRVEGLTILPNEFSPEALVNRLSNADRATGIFCWSEFGAALSRLGRDYMAGTKEFLADLYDGPEHYERVLRNSTAKLERPAISILASSTAEWLAKHVTEEDLGGGFFSRFLFIRADQRKPLLHFPPSPDMQLQNRLVTHLNRVRQSPSRDAKLSQMAVVAYKDTLEELNNSADKTDSAGTAKLLLRLGTPYLLKLALINEVSRNPEATEISQESMLDAVDAIEWLRESASSLFQYGFPTSQRDRLQGKVHRLITESRSGIDRSKLLRRARCQASELDSILRTLFEMEEIIKREQGSGRSRKIIYISKNGFQPTSELGEAIEEMTGELK